MNIEKLYECIEKSKAKHSQSREALFRMFLDDKNRVWSVAEIEKGLKIFYDRRVSKNTIYRHLSFFMENSMILALQDDFKRSFYCLKDDKSMLFSVCPKCKKIKKITNNSLLCKDFENCEFITLHRNCKNCKK